MRSILVLFIDSELPYIGGRSTSRSLLVQPLGCRTVLDRLARRTTAMGPGELLVMPAFEPEPDYSGRICESTSSRVRVVHPAEIGGLLCNADVSDGLLVIEPRFWPTDDYRFEALAAHLEDYRGATHVVAMDAGVEAVRERVERDSEGLVRRISRLYSLVDWTHTTGSSTACSMAPARSVAEVAFRSVRELRAGMLARGGLNRDVPLDVAVLNLEHPEGLLALHDRLVLADVAGDSHTGFLKPDPEIWIAEGAEVHPDARLVAPVIIHPRARVAAGATVIGPTVIGPGAVVGADAMVAQSLVAAAATIPAQEVVRRQVWSGTDRAIRPKAAPCADLASMATLPSGRWRSKELSEEQGTAVEGRRLHLIAQRVCDLVLSSLALVVLSPLLLVVGLLVKLNSPGPVFFRHRRECRGGEEFACLKFRTMTANAHLKQRELYAQNQVDGPQFKLREDPRVTRLGRLLRATNIDELPQLINVVLGHMSLVGPRPSPFRENQICVPWRRARLSVRPGITGLWQVCRDEERAEGDFHEWIYYDILFVRHFSFWLYLRILVATILTAGGRWSAPLAWVVGRGRAEQVTGGTQVVS